MSLGEKIKAMRQQAALSQEQFAEKLNMSRQAVTKWETGKGIPDIANLIAISEEFDVSLSIWWQLWHISFTLQFATGF